MKAKTGKKFQAIVNGKIVNSDNMTYRDLKELVPATPKGRMPKPSALKGKILFKSKINDSEIVIYKDGYLTFTANDGFGLPSTTVYTVHGCSKIYYQTGCSSNEYKEECGSYTENCKLTYRKVGKRLIRTAVVSEEAYLDEPWWMPIFIICEERLTSNSNKRERKLITLMENVPESKDNGSRECFCKDTGKNTSESNCGKAKKRDKYSKRNPESWLNARITTIKEAMNHLRLVSALKNITDNQYNVIKSKFENNGRSEREVAKKLKIKHQTVHESLVGGINNLKDLFFK